MIANNWYFAHIIKYDKIFRQNTVFDILNSKIEESTKKGFEKQ